MIEHKGVWLPDGEKHLVEALDHARHVVDGKPAYQYHKLVAAIELTSKKRRRVAVDVGAHVGLWSSHLALLFKHVHAFEPMPEYRACFLKNVIAGNVTMHEVALGGQRAEARMTVEQGSSGNTRVAMDDDVAVGAPVEVHPLDEYSLADVDLLKIDTEGYEMFVVRGAEETLRRCHPTVVVEQKKDREGRYGLGNTDAVTFLESLGAKVRKVMAGDYILTW